MRGVTSLRLILAAVLLCTSTLCSEHYAIAKKQSKKHYKHYKTKQAKSYKTSSYKMSANKAPSKQVAIEFLPLSTSMHEDLKSSNAKIIPQSYASANINYPRYFTLSIGRSIPTKKFGCYKCTSSSEFTGKEDYKKKFNAAKMYSAALGAKLGNKVKVDLSLSYRGKYKYYYFISDPEYNGNQRQKIDSWSVLLNGYIIPYKFNRIEPYITAGAGIAFNNAGDLYSGKQEEVEGQPHMDRLVGKMRRGFAWTMGLGSTFSLSNHIKIDCVYKYTNIKRFLTTDAAPNPLGLYDKKKAAGGILKLQEIGLGIIYEY